MVEHPGITVIMGLFGPGYAGRVRTAVRSIQRQTLALEVVLSERKYLIFPAIFGLSCSFAGTDFFLDAVEKISGHVNAGKL